MKISILSTLALICTTAGTMAQSKILCFEKNSDDAVEQIYLVIDGEFISGSQYSSAESGTAYGKLSGKIREDGVIQATYSYDIENQPGSHEQLFKIEGDKLLEGVGELKEHGPNQMVLKDPNAVEFTKVFNQVPLSIPAPDSAEAKSVTGALQGPLAEEAGVPVQFDGIVRTAADWAYFEGMVSPADGETPKDKEIATKLSERKFQAFLKKTDKGDWMVLRSAFAVPEGYFEYQDEGEAAPWQLTENPNET